MVLSELNKLEEAIEQFDKAIKLNPNDFKTYSSKGITLLALGKPEQALEQFDMALKINPNDSVSLTMKKLILSK
ncbi:MAG: tetratricopeptide repeat protein [Rickettsiaceae bacterium]|nr:tetratricopeptide repeat protein [Rickettsiaceae bacterium]